MKAGLQWLKVTVIGLITALLFLVVLSFAALLLLRGSPARLEVVLEQVASRILDRELQIGELLEAELNWDTYLLARDVVLANPAWADEPDFVRVGRLLVRINIPSIWRDGPILITQLQLTDASVNLLAFDDNPATWDFWPGEAEDNVRDGSAVLDEEREAVFPLQISEGQIDRAELIFRDGRRDIVASIKSLMLREPDDGTLINLDLVGLINEIPLEVKGQLGPTTALVTLQDLRLDLMVGLGELSLEARGSIADLENFTGPDLHLKIAGPRSRPLLDILGMTEVRDGPLSFSGHITDANPGLALTAVGALDEFHLQVSGEFTDPMAVNGVDIAFKIDGPSLAEVGGMFELEGLSDHPFEVSGKVQRQGSELTLSEGLLVAGEGRLTMTGYLPDFPEIDDWEMEISSSSFNLEMLGPLVGAEGLPEIPYDIKGTLASTEEGVELMDLRIHSPESSLVINGIVGEAPDYMGSRIDVELSGTNMASSGLWIGLHDLPHRAYQVSGAVEFSELGWQLSELLLVAPGLHVAAGAVVDKLPEPTAVTISLKLDSPNLADALEVYGYEVKGLPYFPITVSTALSGTPDKLKIDKAIIESGASHVNLSGMLGDPLALVSPSLAMNFSTPDLLKFLPITKSEPLPELPVDVSGDITVLPGGIGIKGLKGMFGGASVALDGFYDAEGDNNNSRLTGSAEGSDLEAVLGPWVEHELRHVPFQLSLDAKFESGGLQVERFEAKVAETQLSAQINIDTPDDLASAHGNFKISGPSSSLLAQILGADQQIPDADYTLSVGIQQSPDWLQLNPIALQWGKGDLSGSVDLRLGEIPVIRADLHSKFVNLPFLLPNMSELENEEAASVAAGHTAEYLPTDVLTKKELAERVIPDDPLDFDWLNNTQASIKYKIDEIYLHEDATSNAAIDISIADGVLTSRQLSWDGTFISGDAELTIAALEEGAQIDAYVDVKRIPLLLMLGGEPHYDDDAFYRAQFKTAGNNFRGMAKNLNGALVFKAGGGRIDNKGIDLILGDVLEELMDRLNPFSNADPYTKIICHAGAMTIKDGKMAIKPGFVLRTDKMDIATGGSLNLHNEKLDIVFSTRSRKGIGISAGKAITPYFKIGGTLANPRLVLDAKGAALSGGAAVATAGLSILAEGLWDRWVATAKNPCEELITKIPREEKQVFKALL